MAEDFIQYYRLEGNVGFHSRLECWRSSGTRRMRGENELTLLLFFRLGSVVAGGVSTMAGGSVGVSTMASSSAGAGGVPTVFNPSLNRTTCSAKRFGIGVLDF